MNKITIEIPDELMSRLEQQSSPVQEFVIKALENYIKTESLEITKTRTWELCGSLEISELDPKYIIGKDNHDQVITNYAENIDTVILTFLILMILQLGKFSVSMMTKNGVPGGFVHLN